MKVFNMGSDKFGLIVGKYGFIVTEPDFIHTVHEPGETVGLREEVDQPFREYSCEELVAASRDMPVGNFGHYWGIKSRVHGNYRLLLGSMKEIGADTSVMPKWGE